MHKIFQLVTLFAIELVANDCLSCLCETFKCIRRRTMLSDLRRAIQRIIQSCIDSKFNVDGIFKYRGWFFIDEPGSGTAIHHK